MSTFLKEEFYSIDSLLKTIESRENNHIMRSQDSSRTGSRSFTGTESFEEAVNLFRNGYDEKLSDIKEAVRKNNKIVMQMTGEKVKPKNFIVGYIPNVPNAIQNKPDSMIFIDKTPSKRKTLSLIYCMGANCGTDAEDLAKAGAALVSAVNIVEQKGIQTKLSVNFFPAECGDEIAFPTYVVKNYGERFNLLKICFPMIHPSMFRRIGFKWIETCPTMKETGWPSGYGHEPSLDTIKEANEDKNTYVINYRYIADHDFDIEEILKKVEVI